MEQGVIVWSDSSVCLLVNSRFYRLLDQDADYLHVCMHRTQYYRSMIENGDATPEMVRELERNGQGARNKATNTRAVYF